MSHQFRRRTQQLRGISGEAELHRGTSHDALRLSRGRAEMGVRIGVRIGVKFDLRISGVCDREH